LLIATAYSAIAQEAPRPTSTSVTSPDQSDAWKIENALSAGPKFIADRATIMDWPSAQDKEMRVLREGSNGWTCMPGPPGTPRYSPMCNDQTMMKWMMAVMAGKKPDIDSVGVSYMLQGEAGSDVQDLNAKTPPPGKDWYYAGPHVMLALPDGDKDALKDVGQDTSSGLPYVRGPNSPYPLLVIPVARADEEITVRKTAQRRSVEHASSDKPTEDNAMNADNNMSDEIAKAKIRRALLSGPESVTREATVAEMDAQGKMTVLRPGTNQWVCIPGNENIIGQADMCADPMGMRWMMDVMAKKPKPSNTEPGLIYMLNGATQHSYTDPFDRTSAAIPIGPHWMILWPFDAKAAGLPTVMRDAGTLVMFAGTPYAHLHVSGSPWDGNEYHPGDRGVWTMTYARPHKK
jgi:hypothetical protein